MNPFIYHCLIIDLFIHTLFCLLKNKMYDQVNTQALNLSFVRL